MTVVTKLDRLREIALDQHGFVTSAQALEEGVATSELTAMAQRGRVQHAARGVYRVLGVPETPFDELHLALLWTGVDEACLSHDTALAAWDVSDVNPTTVHLTIGRARRLRRAGGDGYLVHHQDLADHDVTWWEGMRTTTLAASVRDCIHSGVPTYLLRQALERGARSGGLDAEQLGDLRERLEARDGAA